MAGGAEPILLDILVILVAAKIGGEIAERLGQSSVLGELLMGVVIGYFAIIHSPLELAPLESLHPGDTVTNWDPKFLDLSVIRVLAELGVIILLFEVGLESDVKELIKVGPSSLLVGVLGIVVSFAAGFGGSWVIAQQGIWADSWLLHTFIGATLTATSVGITARVLADMGKLNTSEARIVLGAAVFDDIGGLLILAIVGGLAAGAALGPTEIAIVFAKAIGFLAVTVGLGIMFLPRLMDAMADRMHTKGATLTIALVFMLGMSYLAGIAGLAPIVGAFAGGLVLAQAKSHQVIFNDIKPLGAVLIPFFFVVLGVQVDLTAIGDQAANVLIVGFGLAIIAIIAKLAAGLGVLKGQASRYVVGVGMVPRGEVGLIFAVFGLRAGLVENWEYTALILVVMLTTFITPLWLKWIAPRMHAEGEVSPHHAAQAEITDS